MGWGTAHGPGQPGWHILSHQQGLEHPKQRFCLTRQRAGATVSAFGDPSLNPTHWWVTRLEHGRRLIPFKAGRWEAERGPW